VKAGHPGVNFDDLLVQGVVDIMYCRLKKAWTKRALPISKVMCFRSTAAVYACGFCHTQLRVDPPGCDLSGVAIATPLPDRFLPTTPDSTRTCTTITMVYRYHAPATKVATVKMAIQGLSLNEICRLLGSFISRQSFGRWIQLYEETRCVLKDPETYEARGRPTSLSDEECQFMIRLVQSEPGLFLDEIQERLYDSSGVLLSVEGIHRNLVERLSITLKKPDTKSIRKSLSAKYTFVEKMEFYPAEFLVFTGEFDFIFFYLFISQLKNWLLACFGR
jgi:transposase